MGREADRQALIDLIINAKRTDPETGSFTEWLADFLLGYGVTLPQPSNEPLLGWVSVEKRLPDENVRVLVFLPDVDALLPQRMDTDRVVNGRWVRWYTGVTHWMPLPALPDRRPPEGEADGK